MRACSILTSLWDTTVEVTGAQMFQLQLCDICTAPNKTFHFGNSEILASWSEALHEKFVATHLVRESPTLCVTWRFSAMFRITCHYPELYKPHHHILYLLRSVLTWSSHPLLVSQVVFLLKVSCPNFCVQFSSPISATCATYLSFFITILILFHNDEVRHNAVSLCLLLLPLLKAQIFSWAPCSNTPVIHVVPKFHSHMKQQEKLWVCVF